MNEKWKIIKKKYRNMKFRNKLLLTYFVIGLVPTFLLGIFCYHQTRTLLMEREQKNLQTSLDQAVNNIDNQINIYNNLSDYIAYNQTISQIIGYDYKNNYEMYRQYNEELDPMLSSLKYFHNDLTKITIYTDNIKIKHDTTLDSINEVKNAEWYKQISKLNNKDIYWDIDTEGKKMISVRKIESLKIYNIKGYLYLELPSSKLFDNFQKLSDNGYGIVMENERGQEIFSFHKGNISPLTLAQCKSGKKEYTSVTCKNKTKWKVWLYESNKTIYQKIQPIVFVVVLVVIGCIVLSILAATMVSKIMVSRILKLKKNMNAVEAGKMEIMVTSDSQDEVGELIRGFGNMITRINMLIERVYKGEITQKEYEMKALQAQINPHFLYNSLSLINWKALEAEQMDISRITLLLSTFYRTSLNKGNNILSIEDELKNMRSYLDIQLMMHDNNFDVEVQVPKEIYPYATLNLVLQPLIENAIDHGIDLKENGRGKLTITGKIEEDDIYLMVEDNGIGMEEEKAQLILTQQSKGYGVRNVKERIELFFGKEYGLSVQSVLGEGTTITIHMPKREM